MLSSKTTGCAARSLRTCLPLSEQSTSNVLRDNYLFQTDRGPTGRNALASWKLSLPPPFSRPRHTADVPVQLLDFSRTWSARGDNDIHLFDIPPLALAGPISHGILAHFPNCLLQSQNSSPGPNVAHSVDNSASRTCGLPHLGEPKLRACYSHASGLDRYLRASSIALGRTTALTAAARTSRRCHQQYWLTVRVSLQKLMFRPTPSARIPWPVKLEHLPGLSLSPSGYP